MTGGIKVRLIDADKLSEDCLYVETDIELSAAETVEAIPCDYIRDKARNATGAESTYLRKLLKEWENE